VSIVAVLSWVISIDLYIMCLLVQQNEIYGEIPIIFDSAMKTCINYARKKQKNIFRIFSAWKKLNEGK
jgi:hypothetical protein